MEKTKKDFGIDTLVMVADPGMISNVQAWPGRRAGLDAMRKLDGVDWITALKSGAIAKLIDDKTLQPDLFDERNLMSLETANYPGERLVACRNPALAKRRCQKRLELLAATAVELDKVKAMVLSGTLSGAARIGVRVGKVIAKFKVAKHFKLDIEDGSFRYEVDDVTVAAEAALDGIYVIRTSVGAEDLAPEQAVLNYKKLADVGRAFRTFKGVEPGSTAGPGSSRTPDQASARKPCPDTYIPEHVGVLW